jgi:hypothetical protein
MTVRRVAPPICLGMIHASLVTDSFMMWHGVLSKNSKYQHNHGDQSTSLTGFLPWCWILTFYCFTYIGAYVVSMVKWRNIPVVVILFICFVWWCLTPLTTIFQL